MVKDNPIAGIAMVCRDSKGTIIGFVSDLLKWQKQWQLKMLALSFLIGIGLKFLLNLIAMLLWIKFFSSSEGISWILSASIDSINSFQAANPQVQCSFIGEKQTGCQTRWLFNKIIMTSEMN